MEEVEEKKFNAVLAEGYKELITKRPKHPLHHFIYYILSTLPPLSREKDSEISAFFKAYEEENQDVAIKK
jgi:hypothetical protein